MIMAGFFGYLSTKWH